MDKIKIGTQVTAKVRHTNVTVSGTFQGYELEDQEDPTSVCGKVFYVKDGMQHLDYVYVDSIKVCKGEDEDERIRKALIDGVRQIRCKNGITQEQMLAYLEKQKEQKPAEWSEEDKTHLCWIIECFDSWKYQVPEFADQYQSAIDWLKSLRPDSYKNCNSRWKPSEEQMDWLESAVKLSIDKPHIHGIIISLYEQLKRL